MSLSKNRTLDEANKIKSNTPIKTIAEIEIEMKRGNEVRYAEAAKMYNAQYNAGSKAAYFSCIEGVKFQIQVEIAFMGIRDDAGQEDHLAPYALVFYLIEPKTKQKKDELVFSLQKALVKTNYEKKESK